MNSALLRLYWIFVFVKMACISFSMSIWIKGLVWHFGKYSYLLSETLMRKCTPSFMSLEFEATTNRLPASLAYHTDWKQLARPLTIGKTCPSTCTSWSRLITYAKRLCFHGRKERNIKLFEQIQLSGRSSFSLSLTLWDKTFIKHFVFSKDQACVECWYLLLL